MKLTISGRDMTVRNDLRSITEKRIAKLTKFFDDNAEVNVIYSKKRNLQIAEITVYANGTYFRSEVEGDTFNNSLDEAIEAIVRQIRKNKTRLAKLLRADAFDYAADEPELDEAPEFLIRTKSFPIKPMSVEEAILQMNLLDHMFFVFRDAQSMEICVVYKRKDGAYGLIAPQEIEGSANPRARHGGLCFIRNKSKKKRICRPQMRFLVTRGRIELPFSACEGDVLAA